MKSSPGWFNYRRWIWSSSSSSSSPSSSSVAESSVVAKGVAEGAAAVSITVAGKEVGADTKVAEVKSATPDENDSNTYYYDDEDDEDELDVDDAQETPLCPTSEQLEALHLKSGANQVVFSVRTGLRGVQTVSCQLFLWEDDAPIVISDVDGTITRSDVPGQFLPYVGRDWSQKGVAELFSRIQRNGYNIVYLTARSIGQANSTRGFITSLTQDGSSLPNGPVFMSPDRLLHAFNREVIERRPEVFKIRCLESLKGRLGFLFLGRPSFSFSLSLFLVAHHSCPKSVLSARIQSVLCWLWQPSLRRQ